MFDGSALRPSAGPVRALRRVHHRHTAHVDVSLPMRMRHVARERPTPIGQGTVHRRHEDAVASRGHDAAGLEHMHRMKLSPGQRCRESIPRQLLSSIHPANAGTRRPRKSCPGTWISALRQDTGRTTEGFLSSLDCSTLVDGCPLRLTRKSCLRNDAAGTLVSQPLRIGDVPGHGPYLYASR